MHEGVVAPYRVLADAGTWQDQHHQIQPVDLPAAQPV